MHFNTSHHSPLQSNAELLAILLPAGDTWAQPLQDLGGFFAKTLLEHAQSQAFDASFASSFSTPSLGLSSAKHILLLGAGSDPLSSDQLKELGGHISRRALTTHSSSIAVHIAPSTHVFSHDTSQTLALIAEGAALGAYTFNRYKTSDDTTPTLNSITFLNTDTTDPIRRALSVADAISSGTALARDLGNEPPNVCTPNFLAQTAQELAASYGMECTIFTAGDLVDKGMNLIHAVGRGASDPPCMAHLILRPSGEVKKRIAFVGKGVTFDTGGYSLKPSAGQKGMHLDMCGGAAVLGAAKSLGQIKPEHVEIHFIVPSAKNSVSSNAYTVNEVIRGYGGKTVEILNTDAEGRLLLADALSYATELGVDEIINLATLTGACVVALGDHTSGLFSNTDDFATRLLNTAKTSGERIWHMPLDKKLRPKLNSNIADIKNIGDRWGGAITAALFLSEWVKDTTWAHLDIAGPAMVEAETPISLKGASGVGVALLTHYALSA